VKKNGKSSIWAALDAAMSFRGAVALVVAVAVFFERWPFAFLGILILALVYSVYRIVKDRKTTAVNMNEALDKDLHHLAELLHKYGHQGQADVVDQIQRTVETPIPDYDRLAGIEVWGGSGAVWEVRLTPRTSSEQKGDEKSFLQTIIRIASAMDRLKIGTERSRSTAKIFQEWLDKGNI